jgi:PleD family two-component response regulator
VALAMVDIDHFKLYNDHAAGDRCLQRVATALSQSVRGGDLIARYGGEEFALVMPALASPRGHRSPSGSVPRLFASLSRMRSPAGGSSPSASAWGP